MALVTIRNPEMAHNRTVVAATALKNGMIVKLVQGAAKGDPCKAAKISAAADLTDSTIVKGIVTYVPDNDLTVDFILNPANEALTLNTDAIDLSTDIPSGALCVFWYNKPLVGYHSAMVDSSIVFSTAREADVIACEESNSLPAALDTGMSSTSSHAVGMIYEHEGAEITILYHLL